MDFVVVAKKNEQRIWFRCLKDVEHLFAVEEIKGESQEIYFCPYCKEPISIMYGAK